MKCNLCKQPLMVSNSSQALKGSKVENTLNYVCVNRNCEMYCGKDLSNPKKVAKTKKK